MSIYAESANITINTDDWARVSYVNFISTTKVDKGGDNMTGNLSLGGN